MIRNPMSDITDIPKLETPIKPSQALRRHFISLGRQLVRWSKKLTLHTVTIGVTRLEHRTGTSTVGYNLASSLAKIVERDVLFVESDFGNPFLVRRRANKRAIGLSDLLSGDMDSSKAYSRIKEQEHLFALGPGTAKEGESVELPLDNLRRLVDDQMTQFDFVVFDLPIADGLSACDSLASQMDGIILVVEATDIDQRKIESFRNRMQRMGVEIIGLVINKA